MEHKSDLAAKGQQRIEWARLKMPVVRGISRKWKEEKPLAGLKVGACLHVTTKTANLVMTLKDGGAEVRLCASNPLSTQDDVVAALNEIYGINTYARRGESNESFYQNIQRVLEIDPLVTVDDGADLVNTLHSQRPELLPRVLGGTEETTTGVIRLKAMAKDGVLKYPVIAVNDAMTKHMFDNRYGTGQSTIDGILRATNYLLAGSIFVVVGYGWCGRGIASRARGMGARVTIVEVDPVKALEAVMDGYDVTSMEEIAPRADMVVTATGNLKVVDEKHLGLLKSGAIISNAGHFNVEIDLEALQKMSQGIKDARENIQEYTLKDRRKIYVIGEGRLVNLAAGEGHPADVMDMSFANQALSVEYISREGKNLGNQVYPVPQPIDREIARLKLISMGIRIGQMTPEQEKYLDSWNVGT